MYIEIGHIPSPHTPQAIPAATAWPERPEYYYRTYHTSQ